MRRVNLHSAQLEHDDDPPGYRTGYASFGPELGAVRLGGTLYELPPGQALCPYHYEHGDEEWALVLSGTPTLRDPDGLHPLEPGDVVCFPAGPQGAHQVRNDAAEPARVLMLSTMRQPKVIVYPDSDKVGVRTADGTDKGNFRRAGALGYWDGEPVAEG